MKKFLELNLVVQIIIGMVVGIALAILRTTALDSLEVGNVVDVVSIFGTLFTGALKAIAPILVFFLIMNTIAGHEGGNYKSMAGILKLYVIGTFVAALIAVIISFVHPVTIIFPGNVATDTVASAPQSLTEVFSTILGDVVDNPVNALATANYLGILSWAILLGVMLKSAGQATKVVLNDLSDAIMKIVKIIIAFAPLGIMGLIYQSVVEVGVDGIVTYTALLVNLLGAMFIVAFIINPAIAYFYTKENPYPLVFTCLRESGVTAFFTRSSAANIPVNISLAKKLGVDSEIYNLSIPLGSTINMGGAAITITTLTLAAAHTVGIEVTFFMAVLLSVLATLSACGASGVSGGSLLLIPLACSIFGIDADIAAQVVSVGFIISVIQDSCETGLNSSSDILYTTIVDRRAKRNAKQEVGL